MQYKKNRFFNILFEYTQKVAEIEHWQVSLSASIFGSLKTAAESVLKCQIKTAAQKAAVCFIARIAAGFQAATPVVPSNTGTGRVRLPLASMCRHRRYSPFPSNH